MDTILSISSYVLGSCLYGSCVFSCIVVTPVKISIVDTPNTTLSFIYLHGLTYSIQRHKVTLESVVPSSSKTLPGVIISENSRIIGLLFFTCLYITNVYSFSETKRVYLLNWGG